MEYINIGTDTILEEYFYPVVNSDKIIKPAGGFWCTNHISAYYNEWIDFITSKPIYYTRYMGKDNPFKLSGAIVTMKDDARILTLDSVEPFQELERKYKFDFEAVSEKYDAIYFDIYKLYGICPKQYEELKRLITVNTMLLLNLRGIKDYKKAQLDLEPFDYSYEYGYEVDVDISNDEGGHLVIPESAEYQQLLEDIYKQLKDIIFHLRLENRNVPSYIIVEMVRKELMNKFGEAIKEYVTKKGYDEFRIANSMAIKSFRKVK